MLKLGGEPRFEPNSKVGNSPLVKTSWMVGNDVKLNIVDNTSDCHGIESNGLEGGGRGMIDCNDYSMPALELVDVSKPELELDLIDFKDFSKPRPETTDFSEPEPELESMNLSGPEPELGAINFKNCSTTELKTTELSDSEPESEYFFKPKTIETDMILGICTEKPEKFIKEIGFQSTDRVGISLLPHFSKPEPDLELIGLKDFSVPKTECINFSDP